MGGFDVGFAGALLAGILSFLSPCVLPLVPPYLCFLGGVTFDQLTGEEAADRLLKRRVLYASAAFVLGFMTVFTLLGATVTVLGQLVAEYIDVFSVVAGAVIIVMGLHFVGLVRIPFLYREARFHVEARPVGLVGAFVVGLAFAFGWTPCVGPVLATILFVAAAEGSLLRGLGLLMTYALGIGIPFIAAALAVGPFLRFARRIRRHLGTVERVIGVLLIGTGVLFATGTMSELGYWLLEAFPALGTIG